MNSLKQTVKSVMNALAFANVENRSDVQALLDRTARPMSAREIELDRPTISLVAASQWLSHSTH